MGGKEKKKMRRRLLRPSVAGNPVESGPHDPPYSVGKEKKEKRERDEKMFFFPFFSFSRFIRKEERERNMIFTLFHHSVIFVGTTQKR